MSSQKCPECGHTEIFDMDCSACDGAGEKVEYVPCDDCSGSGIIDGYSECHRCGFSDTHDTFDVVED